MTAASWPMSRQRATDSDGDPLPAALAFFFDPGTTTPRTVYTDAALAVPHEHPVEADSGGRFPRVFLPTGDYRERVTAEWLVEDVTAGTTQWDDDNIDPMPAVLDDESEATPDERTLETGILSAFTVGGVRTGKVRGNARTIGSATSGATERANADTEDLFTHLYNGHSNTICPVSGGRGANAAADWAANKTIGLIDYRFKAIGGVADMGNTALTVNAAVTFVSGDSITAGSQAGAQTSTLIRTDLPNFALTPTVAGLTIHAANAGAISTGVTAGSSFNVFSESVNGAAEAMNVNGGVTQTVHNNTGPMTLGTVYLQL